MPNELIDSDPSDFNLALENLEFVSHKARLIHKIEVISRDIPLASDLQKIRLQQEILILQQKIKELETNQIEKQARGA